MFNMGCERWLDIAIEAWRFPKPIPYPYFLTNGQIHETTPTTSGHKEYYLSPPRGDNYSNTSCFHCSFDSPWYPSLFPLIITSPFFSFYGDMVRGENPMTPSVKVVHVVVKWAMVVGHFCHLGNKEKNERERNA